MDQGLTSGLGQEGLDDIGIGDVGQLVALPREASDVLMESFLGLLSVILQILGVPRAHVGALEISHKDLLQLHLALNPVGRKVLQSCSCRIGQEQGEVADNEVITIRTASLTSKPVILEPPARVRFPGVF